MAELMRKEPTFYQAFTYPKKLEPGVELEIKRSIEFSAYHVDKCNLAELSKLPLKELQDRRKAGVASEKAVFEKVLAAVQEWEIQAAQTMLLDRAIEYVKTPTVKHTANEWKRRKDGSWEISNLVYNMRYKITQETEGNHKGQWLVTWGIALNRPQRPSTEKYYYSGETMVVEVKKKYYNAEAEAQHYIQGRFDVYAHLFKELSPPIPDKLKRAFFINGVLLPGYTVAPPDRAPQEVAAELASLLVDSDIELPTAEKPSKAQEKAPKEQNPNPPKAKQKPAPKKKPLHKKKKKPAPAR